LLNLWSVLACCASVIVMSAALALVSLLCALITQAGAATQNVTYFGDVAQLCRDKLLQDSDCCLDQQLAPEVLRDSISRPGTEWLCEAPTCYDAEWPSGAGVRGTDSLWWPKGADCSSARIVFVHGGNWMYGSPFEDGYDVLGSKLAAVTRAVVMVIDYRLLPVGNYSDIVQSGLEALVWLSTHGPEREVCSTSAPQPPLFLAGDSAGGGSALTILLRAHAEPEQWPALAGAFVYSPWANLACDTPTYYSNSYSSGESSGQAYSRGDILFKAAPVESTAGFRASALAYVAGNQSLLKDPMASPSYATPELLDGLPPVYMAVSGDEQLEGDSIIFAQRASAQNVAVWLDIFPGMWHDFTMYSEGCDAGTPLWQGALSLQRTGEFVRLTSELRRSRDGPISGQGGTWIHYPYPSGHGLWSPTPPLQLHRAVSRG